MNIFYSYFQMHRFTIIYLKRVYVLIQSVKFWTHMQKAWSKMAPFNSVWAGNHTQKSWTWILIVPSKCPPAKKEGEATWFTVTEVGDHGKAQNKGREISPLSRQTASCPICFPRLFYKFYIYTLGTSEAIGFQKPTVLNNYSASSSTSLKQNLQISSSFLTNTGFSLWDHFAYFN